MHLFGWYVYLLALALLASANIIGTIVDNLASHCGEDDALHEKSGKCFPLLAVCPGLMKFYDSGAGYGDCDESIGKKLIGFWRPHNRCYHLYTQGPCQFNQWIVMDRRTNSTKCELNPCPRIPGKTKWDLDSEFWFYRSGKCWKTNTRAFCEKDKIFRMWYDINGRDSPDFGVCLGKTAVRHSFFRYPSIYLPCHSGYRYPPSHPKCKRIRLDFEREDSPDD